MVLIFFKTCLLRRTGDIRDVLEFTAKNQPLTDTYLPSFILKILVLILLPTHFS
jgi:hypothetical protein